MKARLKIILLACLVAGSSLMMTSCGPKVQQRKGSSGKTGWGYNDPKWGGFEVAEYVEQEAGPGLVLIEGGTFTMGSVEQDVMYDWNSMRKRVTVSSFYMDETEISNVDYREYLNWVCKVFLGEFDEVYFRALPDTLCWRRRLAFNEPYVQFYFRHPAYNDYPVVGVSWDQASEYCLWRTDRVNEKALIDYGFIEYQNDQKGNLNFNTDAYVAGKYEVNVRKYISNESERPVNIADGIILPNYRLPTEAEWEYAALALIGNAITSPERIVNQRLYPWNGHYVRNEEKANRGLFRANVQRGRGDLMGVAGYLNDNAAPTAPVDSYWPNDYGLYCMAGNVNEWVLDVYRNFTNQDVEEFNPFRGNVFQVLDMDANNEFIVDDTTGRLKYRNMTDEESADRVNYQYADNINYKDGDLKSSIDKSLWEQKQDGEAVEDIGSERMYHNKNAEGNAMTSLVNDRVRVYKGGGWRDRIYWMVPGTRRFLQQDRSSDDIGFRCAMIRVGSPSGVSGKR
ncbi:MAG: SUMF1/EgtB/PvdO family nonheme iron enzyme [Bacteroidales bacterium]|nr:SUMF1/EgtB/PvdO family nonheme iron enzyme [Bacteroidales bacterium]